MNTSEITYRVVAEVERKRGMFIVEHKHNPEYVKIPRWAYKQLICFHGMFPGGYSAEPEKVCGLTACPTDAIESIYDIEVF